MAATVLIVEDEILVAMQLEDILSDAGYNVVGIVPDHVSLRGIADPPQVALVDLNLRDGPTGPEIAWELAEIFGTRIVYITANPGQIGVPAPTTVGVIQKPFSPAGVLAAVACATGNLRRDDLPSEVELVT
jgi:DNA-binding response OmpR family regulator